MNESNDAETDVLRGTVNALSARLFALESQIQELQDNHPPPPPVLLETVPSRDDPDHNMTSPVSRSIERCSNADSIYIYGMIGENQVTVKPSSSQFPSPYYAALRDSNVSPPRIVWGDLSGIVPAAQDVYVKVSQHDTTAGFLYDEDDVSTKLEQGKGILLSRRSTPGGAEKAKIAVYGVDLDQIYGGNDHDFLYNNAGVWTAAPFLNELSHTNVGTSNYDIIRWNTATNAWVIGAISDGITAYPSVDILVKSSNMDTTANYLFEKLTGGTHIALSKGPSPGDEKVTIATTGVMSSDGHNGDFLYYTGSMPSGTWNHESFLSGLTATNPGGSPYDVIQWNAAGNAWIIGAIPLASLGGISSSGSYYVLDSTGVKHALTIVNGLITAIA